MEDKNIWKMIDGFYTSIYINEKEKYSYVEHCYGDTNSDYEFDAYAYGSLPMTNGKYSWNIEMSSCVSVGITDVKKVGFITGSINDKQNKNPEFVFDTFMDIIVPKNYDMKLVENNIINELKDMTITLDCDDRTLTVVCVKTGKTCIFRGLPEGVSWVPHITCHCREENATISCF